MNQNRVHAFGDDALASMDAVAMAEAVRLGRVSPDELGLAAIRRALLVNPHLNAIAHLADMSCETSFPVKGNRVGYFHGVPIFIKDNIHTHGLPTGMGTKASPPVMPAAHDAVSAQILAQGFQVIGKSTMPEFGFNAATEWEDGSATRNPWHADFSPGASSGGAAALVAAGVVPLAHGNDGGGSIRIPASCCGLVGMKPSRGRLVDGTAARAMPINLIAEGVLTRTVRDTAGFYAEAERYYSSSALPKIGLVDRPATRRLRIGLLDTAINKTPVCLDTHVLLLSMAEKLSTLGHHVVPMKVEFRPTFALDFTIYYGFLAAMTSLTGRWAIHPEFDASRLEAFTKGLKRHFMNNMLGALPAYLRLRRAKSEYEALIRDYDLILSPVLTHSPPELGYLNPAVDFEVLFERLLAYAGFTPLHNVAGAPAISVPAGFSLRGVPVGVQFWSRPGQEARLLEIAFEIEQAHPWPRLDQIPQAEIRAVAPAGKCGAGNVYPESESIRYGITDGSI